MTECFFLGSVVVILLTGDPPGPVLPPPSRLPDLFLRNFLLGAGDVGRLEDSWESGLLAGVGGETGGATSADSEVTLSLLINIVTIPSLSRRVGWGRFW